MGLRPRISRPCTMQGYAYVTIAYSPLLEDDISMINTIIKYHPLQCKNNAVDVASEARTASHQKQSQP